MKAVDSDCSILTILFFRKEIVMDVIIDRGLSGTITLTINGTIVKMSCTQFKKAFGFRIPKNTTDVRVMKLFSKKQIECLLKDIVFSRKAQ